MIGPAIAAFAASLAAGGIAAACIRRMPTLRSQLIALALVCASIPLAAVLATGVLMFESHDDLVLLAVVSGAAAAVLVGGITVARGIAARVRTLRAAPDAITAGDLSARAARGGPAELDTLAASLNEMADRLEELLDARRRLVMWAGHDLRTPLASLRAMTEAIEDGLVPAEEYAPAIAQRVGDLTRLVEDLFELARIDAGASPLDLRPAPVQTIIDDAIRGRHAEARAAGVVIEPEFADDLPNAQCAPVMVGRVLDNLLGNALRHTSSRDRIAVRAGRDAQMVRIEVEDSGEGFDPEAIERMFDHFWRGDRARAVDGGGAGLGLAIARGLVEAHGGRIWAEVPGGGGARICFTLRAA